jgi:thiol-disulfide isomerase/thioredoxin
VADEARDRGIEAPNGSHPNDALGETAEDASAARILETTTEVSFGLRGLGITAAVLVFISQIVLLVLLIGTRSDLSELRTELEAGGGIPSLGSGQASPGPAATPSTTSTPVVVDDLPRFVAGVADPALGRNVGDVSGLEYYSGDDTIFSTTDGKARAFMVWAHWCPYCQEELPDMVEWHSGNAARLDGFELVSVTSAMDETASNPLVPYLDSSHFPFPVLYDGDGSLARQLGVNAFPFWVFVAPDGTVVGRAAGGIGADNLGSVFEQLNALAIDGAGALAPAP